MFLQFYDYAQIINVNFNLNVLMLIIITVYQLLVCRFAMHCILAKNYISHKCFCPERIILYQRRFSNPDVIHRYDKYKIKYNKNKSRTQVKLRYIYIYLKCKKIMKFASE